MSVDNTITGSWSEESSEKGDSRRLARTVVPKKSCNLRLIQSEVEVVHGRLNACLVVVLLDEIVNLDLRSEGRIGHSFVIP